jgi:acetyl esterase/lipase
MVQGMFAAMSPPIAADIVTKDYSIEGSDGHKIPGRLYTKKAAPTGAAGILFLHGGGYIAGGESNGGLDLYAPFIAKYVTATGVPFFAPDYRLAPEAQYPTNVDDAHKALLYLFDHAEEFGIDPKRIAVMGDSGGGGK